MKEKLKIKDLPSNERPREKLLKLGVENLTNSELLAIILRTGSRNENVVNLCNRVITVGGGINGLLNLSLYELQNINGVGEAKAMQIIAMSEFARRFNSFNSEKELRVKCPRDLAEYLMPKMNNLKKEYFKLIMLNTKNMVISIKDISIGSLNSSIVHPREVFLEAIRQSSASVILCHNHPSGDPMPSNEDIGITKRLIECGKLLGIEVLDHVIIGDKTYISLKEKGFL